MRSLWVLKRRIVERGSGRLKVACCQDSCVNDRVAHLLSRLPNSNILANVSKLIRLKNAIDSAQNPLCFVRDVYKPVVVRVSESPEESTCP